MFDNVPEWLTEKVKRLRDKIGPHDRETIYFAASGWTISWYLRKDIQDPKADPFFDPPGDKPLHSEDVMWDSHVNRTILVAEALFLMRSSPGFAEQRKRLAEKLMRPAFFELLAAKQFFKAGFEIHARPEIGRRGEDFDFIATRATETVNVEVTALTRNEFSEKTIVNRLHDKRDQLPKTAPAVLYCVIPEGWKLPDGTNWDEILERIAGNFLRSTERINVIVFLCEQHIGRVGGGAALIIIRKPYANKRPALPMDLGFLFGGQRSETARRALATGEGLDMLERSSYDSEFFRWVDTLVPAQ